MRPMLAESANIADLPKYVNDDNWWSQIKADGHRFLIEIIDGKVSVLNRSGMPKTTGVSPVILRCFDPFDAGHWVFDGELVGSRLLIFDLPIAGALVGPNSTFEQRYRALQLLFNEWQPEPTRVELLPCAKTPDEKLALAHTAQHEQREGVMLRHRSGVYAPGRRSSFLLKVKFVKEADCIISDVGTGGHDNVSLTLLDPKREYSRTGIVNVGSASAIGKKPKPEVGDVWEVRFLYVVDPKRPRLYQPRLIRKRDDKGLDECLIDQIALAFTDKELQLKNRSDA